MPFDDEEEKDIQPNRKIGVKLNNANSTVKEIPKKPSKEEFAARASVANEQLNAYAERGSDLALKFKRALDDKTLVQNKTLFSESAERELLSSLVQLGIDMNLDELELEGMGSMGLIMLLFRTVLIQRDKINSLDYNVNLLEKKIKELSATPVDTKK